MDWINVNDRLPKNRNPILVRARGTARQGNITLVGVCSKTGFWFLQNSEAMFGFPNLQYEVTHWQPLPQPPKED